MPGTPHGMSGAELPVAVMRATVGDREANARLAFHFSLKGDSQKADYYFEKCLVLHDPDCLADKASGLIGNSRTLGNDESLRRTTLLNAKEITMLAIANAYPDRIQSLAGYRFQVKCIEEELRKNRATRPDETFCPETLRNYGKQRLHVT